MKNTLKYLLIILIIFSLTSCALWIPTVGVECPSTKEKTSYSGEEEVASRLAANTLSKNANNDTSESDFFLSYRIGVDVQLPINNKFAFETGLHLAGKGNRRTRPSVEEKLNFTYIDIPVIARYNIGSSKFSVNGGLQPSLLLSANRDFKVSGVESSNRVTSQYKILDLAANIGAGYQFKNGIRLGINYDHGLLNIFDNDVFKQYNRTLRFSVGYRLKD